MRPSWCFSGRPLGAKTAPGDAARRACLQSLRAFSMSNSEEPKRGAAGACETTPFDPAAAGWEPYSDDGFIGLIGPFWMRRSGNSYDYAFLAEHKHHNRRGVVQGGMLMTFADRSMG